MIKYESSKNNRMKLGDLKESQIYVEYSILLIQHQATQLYSIYHETSCVRSMLSG